MLEARRKIGPNSLTIGHKSIDKGFNKRYRAYSGGNFELKEDFRGRSPPVRTRILETVKMFREFDFFSSNEQTLLFVFANDFLALSRNNKRIFAVLDQ
jgi:hypothetical protein